MEIRQVDRTVNELLDGPGIQLSELAEKIQRLHIFFSLLIPDMNHEERQLLDEALIHTYNKRASPMTTLPWQIRKTRNNTGKCRYWATFMKY